MPLNKNILDHPTVAYHSRDASLSHFNAINIRGIIKWRCNQ